METLKEGAIVFLSKTEQVWNKPYVMKRHHVYDTRSVILKCKVIEVKGDEFKGELFGNNGFEKDGQTFVFHKNELLVNQEYKDLSSLGVWKE